MSKIPHLSDASDEDEENDIVTRYENEESDNDQNDLNNENDDDLDNNVENNQLASGRRIDPTTSQRHVIRNPIPKLNTERLKGPKGLHTIEKYFEGFKFHGKGHEKADLNRIMKRLEHWSHRLFPKLHFDDFLARAEKLGTKKDLQVFLKKYRQDMITVGDEVIAEAIMENEEDKEECEPVDEFDLLIAEQIEKQKQVVILQEPSSIPHTTTDNLTSAHSMEKAFDELLSQSVNASQQLSIEPVSQLQLSEEVKEKIERNRQQAIQRRLARLKVSEESAKRKKLEATEAVGEGKHDIMHNTCEDPTSG
ncbi:hypothetical protein KM043_003918 [Ampulex compressa]|nr:hypothetical protein KM043_003918 [Ampulex compressa]